MKRCKWRRNAQCITERPQATLAYISITKAMVQGHLTERQLQALSKRNILKLILLYTEGVKWKLVPQQSALSPSLLLETLESLRARCSIKTVQYYEVLH